MLTYRPFFDPLRVSYIERQKQKRWIRKAWAWAVFIVGMAFYAFGLFMFLEGL